MRRTDYSAFAGSYTLYTQKQSVTIAVPERLVKLRIWIHSESPLHADYQSSSFIDYYVSLAVEDVPLGVYHMY